ncbi:MAG: MOSC domain-containing protein [Planctomycetes bacterium]|nr:MOSC domain-containing protein [Planctomycetota bacterium]
MSATTPRVVSIVYTPHDVAPRRPQGNYARVSMPQAVLAEFQGIVGDAKGGVGTRQLNIMSAETLAQLRAEGFKTDPGELGEQIVIAGLDLSNVAAGSRFRIGSAVVEVTLPRTGCARFETIQGKPKTMVTGRLGVLVRVVAGGAVAVGDPVELVPTEE